MAILGLSLRLYPENNVHKWLADDLRRNGFDAVHAQEVGNAHLSDEDHLAWATAHGRTLITYDRDDFPRIVEGWAAAGRDHAGVIVAVAPPRLSAGLLRRRLYALLDRVTAEEAANELYWLDERWHAPDPTP